MRINIQVVLVIFPLSITSFHGPRHRDGPHSTFLILSQASEPFLITCYSYSPAPEILSYFKKVAEDYDLLKYVKLNHTIVGAWWQEEEQQWRIRVQKGDNPEDTIEDHCNILLNASGALKYVC